MKAAKECCRRTFCARSLIFMASASIIFWNELIKRTKTTADAVVFSIKMRRTQQCRLGRHQQDRTNPPPPPPPRPAGRPRPPPPVCSWGSKGAILSRERMAPLSRAAPTALLPRAFGTKKSSLCRENSFSLFFNTALRRPECEDPPSANATFLRRFRDARRRSAYRRSQCPSSCAGAG